MKKFIRLSMACAILTLFSCTSQKSFSLEGSWNIVSANGVSTAEGEKRAFISFDAEGKVNGNASVNSFFGDYELDGESLKLDHVGMTRMMGPHMEIEAAVVDAVNSTSSIKVKGETAVVFDADGKEIMTLEKEK